MTSEDAGFRWAFFQVACAAVRSLAEELAPVAEGLVVFKGVHLLLAGADIVRRPMSDADVAVVGDFDRCLERLASSPRWKIAQDDAHSVIVRLDTGFEIDLHRRPLPAGFGRLDARGLFERGTPEPRLGAGVRVPLPVDAAVLALANYVRDRLGHTGSRGIVEDLRTLRAAGVSAEQVEARARELGLFRVGLVALTGLADDTAREWMDRFGASHAERVVARRLVAALSHADEWPRLTAWVVRALPDGVGSLASVAAQARESIGRNVRLRMRY